MVSTTTTSLIDIGVLSLAISALSLTITKASIFRPARRRIADKNAWLGDLITCPYCMSHWLAFAAVIVYHTRIVHSRIYLLDLLVSAFMAVALASVWSGLILWAFAGDE